MRTIRPLFFPVLLLALAAAAVQPWARVPDTFWPLLRLYSLFILAAGVLLAWGFQRGRTACALAALALAGEALRLPPAAAEWAGLAVPVLLPLNLAAIALLDERPLIGLSGLGRLAFLFVQAGAAALLYFYPVPQLTSALRHDFFSLPYAPLPQPALLAFAATFLLIFIQFLRRPRPIEAGFLGALGGAFLALTMPHPDFFFAVAQTTLVLGLLFNSHAMAYRDNLTGLPSRRALNELLPQLGRQFAVAMVDVDHFKKFNDRYGHDAGDQVLRMIAARLEQIQGAGRAFRYGGEEFTIVFPGRDLDESVDHLEYLRKTIEQGGFAIRGPQRPRRGGNGRRARSRGPARGLTRVRVTVSMGIAETGPRLPDPHSVIRAADRALYRAKKAGRNQISD